MTTKKREVWKRDEAINHFIKIGGEKKYKARNHKKYSKNENGVISIMAAAGIMAAVDDDDDINDGGLCRDDPPPPPPPPPPPRPHQVKLEKPLNLQNIRCILEGD